MQYKWMRHLSIVSAFLLGAVPAGALTIDFDDFVHGEDLADQLEILLGIQLTTMNLGGGPDLGVAFDTGRSGTSDDDLEFQGGWAAGNLTSPDPLHDPALGRILIIQENAEGCGDGVCDDPDDERARPAGTFSFDLSELAQSFSAFAFDLVDVDDAMAEQGKIVFTYQGGNEREYAFEDFTSLGQGVEFGNRSANHIDLGEVGAYDRVVIHMGGSGGVDNLVLAPEPGTLLLVGLGLVGLAAAGRRPS